MMKSPESSARRSRRRRHDARHRTATLVVLACASGCLLSSFATAFSPSTAASRATVPSPSHRSQGTHHMHPCERCNTRLYNLFPKDDFDRDDFLDDDDDEFDGEQYDPAVAAQIRKAKQLLSETKRKQEEKARKVAEAAKAAAAAAEAKGINGGSPSPPQDGGPKIPFFASRSFTSSAAQSSQKIKSKTKTGEIIADGETMASLSKSEPWEARPLSQMFEKEKRLDFDGNLVDEDEQRNLSERDLARNIFNLRKKLQTEDFNRVFDKRNRFIGEVD